MIVEIYILSTQTNTYQIVVLNTLVTVFSFGMAVREIQINASLCFILQIISYSYIKNKFVSLYKLQIPRYLLPFGV